MSPPQATAPWLVFGASGQVGRQVLERCETARQSLLALSRHPHQGPESAMLGWRCARLPDAVPALPPAAAILSLGPLDLFAEWFAQWQPQRGAPRIVALSSMSVVSKAASPHVGERALAARMRHAEQLLADRCDELGLPWTILRPTMLWGGASDRTVSRLARLALRWRVLPMPRGRGLRQPVHVADVAAAVIAAVGCERACGQRIACGGGERLAAVELFRRVHASLPQRTLILPVSAVLLRLLGTMGRFSRSAAAIGRLEQDLTADNAQLETLLGVHPRSFSPRAPDWTA